MKIFCLFLIVFSVTIIVVGIIKVHELPKEIALKRGHPQADAIGICALLGLLIFPFWMIALLWAYMRPVIAPIEIETAAVNVSDSTIEVGNGEAI
ncbi:MAG: DUF3302 domain-containing protein [Halieaceae bacterium]